MPLPTMLNVLYLQVVGMLCEIRQYHCEEGGRKEKGGRERKGVKRTENSFKVG